MDKALFKSCLWLITFAVGLVLLLVKFDYILKGCGIVLSLLSPFFIGFALAFVINLPYKTIEQFLVRHSEKSKFMTKIVRPLSLLLSYLLVFGVIVGVIAIVIPEFGRSINMLLSNSDTYMKNINAILAWLTAHVDWVELQQLDLSALWKDLQAFVQKFLQSAMDTLTFVFPQIYNVTSNIVQGVANFGIGLIVSVYLLLSKETLILQAKRAVYAFLPRKAADRTIDILKLICDCFNNFLGGQLLEACIFGLLCFIGMSIFRFEYAFLISILVAITALIPVVGAFIGAVIAVVLLLLVDPKQAIWFIVFFIVLQQIEGNLIYPKVVGESIGLPALWVLMGIVVGGNLGGILGMLLGVPVFSVLYKLMGQIIQSKLEAKNIKLE